MNTHLKKYCLALDLKDDAKLIAEYEQWHQNVWDEIKESIIGSGIVRMEIYRSGPRLFMIMETDSTFSFERKAAMDATNEKVQAWETLMWNYQQALPWGRPGEKWVIMDEIFSLTKNN
jgi:L-rhamnose mutarotase